MRARPVAHPGVLGQHPVSASTQPTPAKQGAADRAPVAQEAKVVGVAVRGVARAEVLVRGRVVGGEVGVQPAQAADKPGAAAPGSAACAHGPGKPGAAEPGPATCARAPENKRWRGT